MPISEEELRKIVAEVVKNLDALPASAATGGGPVFDTVDAAVAAAKTAQPGFQDLGLVAREKIIAAIREVSRANARRWAEMAVAETGMGRVEDKVIKNMVCIDGTPGVEDLRAMSYTGDKGLTLVEYAPFGVEPKYSRSVCSAPDAVDRPDGRGADGAFVAVRAGGEAGTGRAESRRPLRLCLGGRPSSAGALHPGR